MSLINLWISQDYLNPEQNKDKGIIGHIIFYYLVAWSFFQDFKKDDVGGKIIGCKMHDIVHDFVYFITKNECLIMKTNQGDNNEIEVFGSKVRHLTLTYVPYGSDSLLTSCYKCKKLCILTVFSSRKSLCVDVNLVLQLKCFRTLNLIESSIEELPGKTGQLVHLWHLDLSNFLLEKLQDNICSLYNLYTLVMPFIKKNCLITKKTSSLRI